MTGPEAVARLTGVGLLWMGVHCAGMCGPLLLGLDVGGARAGGAGVWGVAVRTLLYQLGKAVSYAVVGAVAGAVGAGAEDVSGVVPGVFAVVAGAVAVVVAVGGLPGGLRSTPDVVKIGSTKKPAKATAAAALTQRLLTLAQPLLRSTHPARPFVLGLLLAFLPCMISLWALSLAALTSSPLWGALVMLTLAAFTTPLLVVTSVVGRGAAFLSAAARRRLQQLGGVVAGAWLVAIGLAGLGVVDHAHLPLHVAGRDFVLMLF